MVDFETLKSIREDNLASYNLTINDWRRLYIYYLTGGLKESTSGGGEIRLTFPNKIKRTIRTKNIVKRLNDIFRQLLMPPQRVCTDKWIVEIKAGRQLTIEEVLKIGVQIGTFKPIELPES